jgi:protein transport protein SEC24
VGYPGPADVAPAPAPAGGIAGITQGVNQLGVGGSDVRPAVLNQLYTTDLLNTPFNVAELELPPPPIVLPPNVSCAAIHD